MIGLVDFDLLTRSSKSLYIPNLEIMKLATYYKTEEKQFCRLMSLKETELDAYDKIYFFSEQDSIEIPIQFKRAKNVIFGGTTFTKGKYIPFENELIDYTLPKTFIYKEFLGQKYDEGIKTKEINSFLDSGYYRMYAGNNKLPMPAILKKKKIYLYDREFFYPDWKNILNKLSEKTPSTIIRMHPISCSTLTSFFEIRNFTRFSRKNEIILDLEVPYGDIPILFNKYEKKFLADINDSSNVYLPLGKTLPTNNKYLENLAYTLNLFYSFWARNIPMKIKYLRPNIGNYNPINNLSLLIENWSNLTTENKRKTPLIERIKKGSIEEEELNFFLSYYPKKIDLFEQNYIDLSSRGYWRL